MSAETALLSLILLACVHPLRFLLLLVSFFLISRLLNALGSRRRWYPPTAGGRGIKTPVQLGMAWKLRRHMSNQKKQFVGRERRKKRRVIPVVRKISTFARLGSVGTMEGSLEKEKEIPRCATMNDRGVYWSIVGSCLRALIVV